ncbi:MAG: multidrug effflux MFS transporter [Acidimicrobiaceae bacterium]|nr:multidrug effflux MFS transporter [Acidimicrobiaceae bacterium]
MTIARETSEVPGEQTSSANGLGPRELLVMISAIMALMAIAIDMVLPAFDDIRETFGLAADSTQISQVITVFFLGLAIAQLVWGPLADRFGRKPILYAGTAIYVAGAVGSALSPSLNWLLAFRFVWGVGAAGSRVVATAIIRDSFEGTRMAKAMSQIMAVFVMAPVFAPSIGAGLIIVFSWRSIFWFCVICAGIIVVWSMRLPETLTEANRRPLEFRSITAGFGTVLRNPITSGYTFATLFLQGVFSAYLGSSERLIGEIFGRPDQFPLIFGAIAILFAVGAVINGQVVGIFGMKRLIHVMSGAVLVMSVALVAISVTADGTPNFWIFMPMLGVMLAMFMFLMPNLNTAALEPMGDLAGTASSLTGAGRIAGGALLGAVVDSQVTNTTTPFAVAIVLFAIGAIASIVWAEREQRRVARLS